MRRTIIRTPEAPASVHTPDQRAALQKKLDAAKSAMRKWKSKLNRAHNEFDYYWRTADRLEKELRR